jgi:hypothetical protein
MAQEIFSREEALQKPHPAFRLGQRQSCSSTRLAKKGEIVA